jgi:tetratricopeptide (TPR) repeat protein
MPTPQEQAMLLAATTQELTGEAALEASLIVGGAGSPEELLTLERSMDELLTVIVRGLPPGDAISRARALLPSLFAAHAGRALLQRYEADATTLYEAMMTGRFNCVSATTLYILAASRAGIDARAVLLPSHARAVVIASGRRFVVETTTPGGFDPPASVARAARDRARPMRGKAVDLYADEQGTEVPFRALLAVTYGNLSVAAEDRGDTALAAALVTREVALTPPAQAPIVRLQQMGLLSELATSKYNEGDLTAALAFARRAYDAAIDAQGKRLAEQNIAAIASRSLTVQATSLDDAALASFAQPLQAYPHAYGDVQALALTLVAQRRAGRGDVAGSASALHEAATLASSDEMRAQAGQNAIIGEINRMAALSTTDPEAAWTAWKRLPPPGVTLAAVQERAGAVIAQNRAVRLSNDAKCTELDGVLSQSPGIDHADALRASCRARRGLLRADKGDLAAALEDLRAAARLEPSEPAHRENLVVILEKQIDQLVHASRCSEIGPIVAEGRALAPADKFWAETVEYCSRR